MGTDVPVASLAEVDKRHAVVRSTLQSEHPAPGLSRPGLRITPIGQLSNEPASMAPAVEFGTVTLPDLTIRLITKILRRGWIRLRCSFPVPRLNLREVPVTHTSGLGGPEVP
jgi:hypothetical protein